MVSRIGKVMATLFTALFAPILVSIVIQEMGVVRGSAPGAPNGHRPPTVSAGPRDIVISHGLGINPARARHEALSAALHTVRVSETGLPIVPGYDQAAVESILRDPRGVILRCEDLACSRQIEGGREWYRQEISVEVDRTALAERMVGAR